MFLFLIFLKETTKNANKDVLVVVSFFLFFFFSLEHFFLYFFGILLNDLLNESKGLTFHVNRKFLDPHLCAMQKLFQKRFGDIIKPITNNNISYAISIKAI